MRAEARRSRSQHLGQSGQRQIRVSPSASGDRLGHGEVDLRPTRNRATWLPLTRRDELYVAWMSLVRGLATISKQLVKGIHYVLPRLFLRSSLRDGARDFGDFCDPPALALFVRDRPLQFHVVLFYTTIQAHAERHLTAFPNRRYSFWSPCVPVGALAIGLAAAEHLELVINQEYTRRVAALRAEAKTRTNDECNDAFRLLQILEHMRQ